ncbi:hypothetical protein [Ruegeria atlantica]|uniref:hypothetical protein n=1 Tax=Ruegeria atlantica TaxID=81569 RepID=UPI00147CA893|nr:hypothetical protein [Ruegeria atlantica]
MRQAKAGEAWLNELPVCNVKKARILLSEGARLVVHLDETATTQDPCWRITLLDGAGRHWSLVAIGSNRPRLLRSVQLVYQVARNLSVAEVSVPVAT